MGQPVVVVSGAEPAGGSEAAFEAGVASVVAAGAADVAVEAAATATDAATTADAALSAAVTADVAVFELAERVEDLEHDLAALRTDVVEILDDPAPDLVADDLAPEKVTNVDVTVEGDGKPAKVKRQRSGWGHDGWFGSR